MRNNTITKNLFFCNVLINLKFQIARIKKYGFFGIAKRLIKKIVTLVIACMLSPISCLLFIFGYRRLNIFTDRIGHLAIEPDILLKAQLLGLIKVKHWFVLAPSYRVANQHMLKYWDKYLTIIRSNVYCYILYCVSFWPFMRYDVSHFINQNNKAQMAFRVYTLWSDRKSLLQLTPEDSHWGNQQLVKLGIPKGSWFVCVHVREAGFSPVDEVLHSHRNGNINNLKLAIKEIIRQGGWVIRLGDPTMKPMEKMPKVIDYAHHPLRSQRFDIILCAQARFILGNSSGIFIVGSVFGVPCALANMVPMPTLGFGANDLSIPKLHKLKNEKKYLPFKEIMESTISTFRYASLFTENRIEVEENSSEDILALTIEMLERLEGKYVEKEEDKKLHNQYMAWFKPHHYSYGAPSKISFSFLKKYKHLLYD